MSKRTDSNVYTLLFATGMVIVVGALLAFFASALKPAIQENKRIEKQQNILYAMGVHENDETAAIFVAKEKVGDAFSKYITKQLVIEGDAIFENEDAYLIDVKKQQARAKEGIERKLPLFIGQDDNGKTYYIAPIRGKGLWDAVWGYVAMDANMVVQGAYFDHKGETAGLGANITQRYFMDDFIGEHLLKDGKFKGIAISKTNNDPKNEDKIDNEVDAIAGATITGDGVSAMIKTELKKYVAYFNTLKTN
jgi:Na+-transporting NADH:ubiquinone oxidoreductase subunit C